MKRKALLAGLLCGICLVLLLAFLNRLTPPQNEPDRETTLPEDPTVDNTVFTKSPFVLSENADPVGSPYALNKDMDVAEQNGIRFAFEPSIPSEERAQCIRVTEAVLARLNVNKSLQLAVYTPATYGSTFINGDIIYTSLQEWKSPEFVVTLLYGLVGEYSHYGSLYGYANYLCQELFDTPMKTLASNQYYDGSPDPLDLNLLCFHPDFTTEIGIRSAKLLANTFVSSYIQTNGEVAFCELLKKSGDPATVSELVQALSGFYADRGINHTPSQLLFRQGGKGYAYIAKGEYATFYVEKNWVDTTAGKIPLCYDGFLRQNYPEVKQYFTTVLGEMAQYQALFSLDSYNNDLDIYYTNSSNRAGYYPEYHAFRLPSINSFSMLYVGSLVGSIVPQENWAIDGTLAYFSYYYNHYGNTARNYYASNVSDATSQQHYRNFSQWLGRNIDIFTDYTDFSHHYAYHNGCTNPNNGGSDSFIAYLIHRFGEKEVIDILCKTHSFGDCSFDQLVADWLVFLKENYSVPKRAK